MKNSYKLPFRIKKQKEIVHLLHNGRRWKCNLFSVIYLPNELSQDRFAPLVSRKNGGAVERVRIKRVYREAYINSERPDGQCFDILIRPYYNCEHSFHEVLKLYGKWRSSLVQE